MKNKNVNTNKYIIVVIFINTKHNKVRILINTDYDEFL